MYNLLSMLTGAIIAIMISINGGLADATGLYFSSVIIHAVGLITIIVVLLIMKSKIVIKDKIPWYYYSAGAIGILTVLFNNMSVAPLGVSLTLALGLLGQSFASILVDTFGMFGMSKITFNSKKVIGLIIILIGIATMILWK